MAWGQVGNILGPEGPPGPNFVLGGTKTAAFSCDADTFYLVNFPADLGAQTIQLPAAPAQGTRIAFYRLDTNAYTSFANITHGAGDTGDYVLGNSGAACTLQYVGTAWLQVAASFAGLQGLTGAASSATYPPNLMTRDSSGRTEVGTPTTAAHAAPKGYVDALIAPRSVVALTGAATATANAIHMVTLAALATVTLPAAPPDGTVCEFIRLDGILATLTIEPGGTDTISGADPFYLKAPNAVRFVYNEATTVWAQEANTLNGLSGLFSAVATATAGTVMTRDGSGRSAVAAPSATGDIANKGYVDARMPTGSITMFGGAAAPTGWLLCDGASVLRADYADLFAVIGTTYGSVDGTHFTLPNMASKFPRGNTPGTGAGADTHQHAVTGLTANSHTHSLSSHYHGLASHTHGIAATSHTHGLDDHGTAAVVISAQSPPNFFMRRISGNQWTATHANGWAGGASSNTVSQTIGAALRGDTIGVSSDVAGTSDGPSNNSSGTPSNDTSGTPSANGISGSVDSGDNVPAYVAFAFIIKT